MGTPAATTHIEHLIQSLVWNRTRTLALVERVARLPDPMAALAYRVGPGRAHTAWLLMHIGITEELFASQRLPPGKPGQWEELWPRFRGGSTPDDDIPSLKLIGELLEGSRERLLETLQGLDDSKLNDIPPSLAERNWTILDVLHVLIWHEAHHQGQAHLTLNMFENQTS